VTESKEGGGELISKNAAKYKTAEERLRGGGGGLGQEEKSSEGRGNTGPMCGFI